jgi:hypothetical protein
MVSRTIARAAAIGAVVFAVAPVAATIPAFADGQQLTPFRCFTRDDDNVHVVFGPASFFKPPTHQGPTSFKENAGPTVVTFPLYHGTSRGRAVQYVITDASDLSAARALRVNYVPKLAQAMGTDAVQKSHSRVESGNRIDFPASVDFSPAHIIVPSATGFPPAAAAPGAVGEPGYSPLVQVTFGDDKVVLNAPQIANRTGRADKVISIDDDHQRVKYKETDGCYDNESVHYASFDASDAGAAAIEDVTYAPALAAAPSLGCADAAVVAANCSRESLIAFINGQTSGDNRQGLNAALLDGHSPLNILKEIPERTAQFDYSPLWDIHLVHWNDSVPVAKRLRQTDFATAQALVGTKAQSVTPSKTLSDKFQGTGFIVNCPVISLDVNTER